MARLSFDQNHGHERAGQGLIAAVRHVSGMLFRLGDGWFFVDVMRVREVVHPLELRITVGMPSGVTGIMMLRGVAVPVLDVRKRLDHPRPAGETRSRVLVLTLPGSLLGLLVDEAIGVITIAVDEIRPPSSLGTESTVLPCIGTVCVAERLLTLIDIDRLLVPEVRPALATDKREQGHGDAPLLVGCPLCRKKFRVEPSRMRQKVMTVCCSGCRSRFRIARPEWQAVSAKK